MMNNIEELTLHETQQISLNVLKKVIEVCEKLNLTYWITYGTLLTSIYIVLKLHQKIFYRL